MFSLAAVSRKKKKKKIIFHLAASRGTARDAPICSNQYL